MMSFFRAGALSALVLSLAASAPQSASAAAPVALVVVNVQTVALG